MTGELRGLALFFQIGLGTLVAVCVYRLITGAISLRGVLTSEAGGGVIPDRIQAVVITLGACAAYLSVGIGQLGDPAVHALPEVPEFIVNVLLGSQALFLGGKVLRGR
jgi:hypothetical protein